MYYIDCLDVHFIATVNTSFVQSIPSENLNGLRYKRAGLEPVCTCVLALSRHNKSSAYEVIDQLANYYAIDHRRVSELTQDDGELVVDQTTITLSIVTPRSLIWRMLSC